MLKHQILFELAGKLAAMGIPFQQEAGTDMAVRTEFLDAGWSTGSKKISYEALLFANEQDQTMYMYEKTTESGHGLSFGSGSSTSIQSGTTLFRKVKSIQYGPDGKAYEYSLDLGSIPKAVKETAKQHGWKFKTVLDKCKAMYPTGYVPEPVPPAQGQWGPAQVFPPYANPQQPVGLQYGNPQQPMNPQYGNPQQPMNPQNGDLQQPLNPQYGTPSGPFHASAPRKSGGKGGTIGLIGFILLGLVLLVMLWAAEATLVGWLVCLALFAVAFLLQRLLREKGCVLHLVLWIVSAFLLLVALTMFAEGDRGLGEAEPGNAQASTLQGGSGSAGQVDPSKSTSTMESGLPNHFLYYLTINFQNDTTSLVQVNVATGGETVLLETPRYLGLLRQDGGKLYGIAENRIFVVENGGIQYITAEDEYVVRFDVHDGVLYYGKDNSNASDDIYERLARKDVSGQNERILSDGGIGQMVVDDFVYCAVSSGTDIAKLVRYDLDGGNKTVLLDKPCGQLVKSGNFLYFADNRDSGSLYRMKNDGSDLKRLVQGPLTFQYPLPNQINGLTNMGAIDEFLYYINSQDGHRLYRTNGEMSEKLSEEALASLYVKDSHIYCTYGNGNPAGIHLLNENGTQIGIVAENTPNEYVVGE